MHMTYVVKTKQKNTVWSLRLMLYLHAGIFTATQSNKLRIQLRHALVYQVNERLAELDFENRFP